MAVWIDDLITDKVKTVGISGHVSPDGDCVGSCMGLYLYLKKNYPGVRADVFLENVPAELKIIRDTDIIKTDFKTDVEAYDIFFILDSEKGRTAGAEALFDRAHLKVNIDHHVSNKGNGDINHIVPTASSVCELMAQVMDIEKMDTDIATALYTGIVTDTGMFHYSSTSPETMRIAARLMEYGFDHAALVEHVELERTYKQNVTCGRMLAASDLVLDGRCITASLTIEEIRNEQIAHEDMDYVVSQMNLTAGVECAIFAYETEDGHVKTSLRSKAKVNVASIAEAFGGGGHIRASGCTTKGKAKDVIAQMLPYVEAQLSGKQMP